MDLFAFFVGEPLRFTLKSNECTVIVAQQDIKAARCPGKFVSKENGFSSKLCGGELSTDKAYELH